MKYLSCIKITYNNNTANNNNHNCVLGNFAKAAKS